MDLRPLALSYDEESSTLYLSGSVDELSGVALREAIAQHTDGYRRDLTLDLGKVDFLPSLGVGVLAVAMRNAEEHGTRIDLVAEPDTVVQQVLNVCGLPYSTAG